MGKMGRVVGFASAQIVLGHVIVELDSPPLWSREGGDTQGDSTGACAE